MKQEPSRRISQTGRSDWTKLVRNWIVHQHEPELEQAIQLLRRRAQAGDASSLTVAELLEAMRNDPTDRRFVSLAERLCPLSYVEKATFRLIWLYGHAVACETAAEAPVSERAQLLQVGIKSAKTAAALARGMTDCALAAFFTALQARGLQDQHDWCEAQTSFREALRLYRELASGQPNEYHPSLARTLNNLGTVQRELKDLGAAKADFQEALSIYRDLSRDQPKVFRPDVAMTLNNLGAVQRDLNDLQGARATLDDALAIRRQLTQEGPDVYRPHIARTLTILGSVLRGLRELVAASSCLNEALAIWREFFRQRPEVYQDELATTLNNLGNVQRDLDDLVGARTTFRELLAIQRELGRKRPSIYNLDVGNTLNNLGTVQRDSNDLEASRESFREALWIYRDLAQQRPEAYLPFMAGTSNNLAKVQQERILLVNVEHLKRARQERGWTQERLVEEFGHHCKGECLSLRKLQEIELTGKVREGTILALANILEAPFEQFLAKQEPWIIPNREWDSVLNPPGALLLPEMGVVPFHFRHQELSGLKNWCEDQRPISVHLIVGAGGIGKTRLAIQFCMEMQTQAWRAGFLDYSAFRPDQEVWGKTL